VAVSRRMGCNTDLLIPGVLDVRRPSDRRTCGPEEAGRAWPAWLAGKWPIMVAELLDQIVLFQLDADQDVGPVITTENSSMTGGHRGRGPEPAEQDAEIDRVTEHAR